jgi:hypothetical protein
MEWSIGTFKTDCATASCQLINKQNCFSDENAPPVRKTMTMAALKEGKIGNERNPSIPECGECFAPAASHSGVQDKGNRCKQAMATIYFRVDDKDDEITLDDCPTMSEESMGENNLDENGSDVVLSNDKSTYACQNPDGLSYQTLFEEEKVQMFLAENRLLLERLRPCLMRSSMSHEALRQWDK